MPVANHPGIPTNKTQKNFQLRDLLRRIIPKLPLETSRLAIWVNRPLSTTLNRNNNKATPNSPPIMKLVFHEKKVATIPAVTAPNIPIPPTIATAKPLYFPLICSLTKVIPAPSSPANPTPAKNLHHIYPFTSFT